MRKIAVVSLSPWEEFWKDYSEKGSPKTRHAGKGAEESTRTLCSEFSTDLCNVPAIDFAHEGEVEEKELNYGIPFHDPHDPEIRHVELENLAEEDIYPDREIDDEAVQAEKEEKRHDPMKMLLAAKNLLRLLYGWMSDAISVEEFAEENLTNSIIVLYLREKMDGVVKYYFYNLRNENLVEEVLDFVKKMAKYQPAVSDEGVNHILPHARIEKHEQDAMIRQIRNAGISSSATARLISRAQVEQQNPGCRKPNPANSCYAIRLGQALFGKDRFNRMLRA